jgi:ribosomal protein L37AE/L43A
MSTNYRGIDYSTGIENRDTETGIHYGVINSREVCQSWADSSEADYGDPHCPKCGNGASDSHEPECDSDGYECSGCGDYQCDNCRYLFDGDEAFGDMPQRFTLDDGEYVATQSGDDRDIFVIRSPYYTHAQFCSPCAPGAGYLMNPCIDGPKTYCFGPDWFDSDNPCPYPVYSVADDSLVYQPAAD